jgi:ATP-binding cassette, subfamily B (MDR/TAP), member 1
MLGAVPIVVFVFGFVGFITETANKTAEKSTQKSTSIANEVISSIRTVKSMAGEQKEDLKFQKTLTKKHPIIFVKAIVIGLGFGAIFGLIWCVVAVCFIYGGYLINLKLMGLGDLIRVFGFMIFTVMGLGIGGN